MNGAKKDQHAMIRRATKAGCTVEHRGSHIMIKTPNGGLVVASGTPGDVNASRQLQRDMRRAGVVL